MSTTTKRKLSKQDSTRIKCATQGCDNQADYCHTVEWNTGNTEGVSFFYHCAEHNENTRGEER